MALLFTCEDETSLEDIKNELIKYIRDFLYSCQSKLFDSAYFMTFFDLIKCPYLTTEFKEEIIGAGNFPRALTKKEVDEIRTYVENGEWFFDWSLKFDLSRKLRKREYVTPYE
jgi:hypothetical protein